MSEMQWTDPTEAEIKLVNLRGWMADRGEATVVLRRVANVAWLTGGCDRAVNWTSELSPITLVVTTKECVAVVPDFERDRVADEDLRGLDWPIVAYPWPEAGAFERAIGNVGGETFVADVPDLGGRVVEGDLRNLRLILSPREMKRYARLGADVAALLQEHAQAVKPGDRESAIARHLADACLAQGILPATLLVGADERGARYRHPIPAEAPVRHLVLLAISARRGGLWVSCSRLVAFGALSPEELRAFATVVQADAAYIEGSSQSATLGAAMQRGCEAYAQAGEPDGWRMHHQGGLTGYAAREERATPHSSTPLQPGMAFAWNPWLNGLKSEDTVVRAGDNYMRVLTSAPGWPQMPVSTASGWGIERPAVLVR